MPHMKAECKHATWGNTVNVTPEWENGVSGLVARTDLYWGNKTTTKCWCYRKNEADGDDIHGGSKCNVTEHCC